MELQKTTKIGISITTETEVLSYTYTGAQTLEFLARVDLGSVTHPIAGNGNYQLNVYINNVMVVPTSIVTVTTSQTSTIMISRAVPIVTNDIVSIKVIGLPTDTNVDTIAALRDATPVLLSDIVSIGATQVDHNYGGVNNFQYQTPGGLGIGGATITIYLKDDYDSGRRDANHIVARAKTVADGTWARSVLLSPGTYSLIFFLQGKYGPDRADLTIS